MKRSEHRILTTHAGSLPRPAELTSLFARRSVGEAVDERAIETLGRAAVCDIVRRQIEAGLDVIDDGEQSRESFVLYMRRRLTGLGGTGARPMHADLDAYPNTRHVPAARDHRRARVQPRQLAEGDWSDRLYGSIIDRGRVRRFPCGADGPEGIHRSVPDRALARDHRVDRAERALRLLRALSRCARRRAAGRIRGDRTQWISVAARLPRPRA